MKWLKYIFYRMLEAFHRPIYNERSLAESREESREKTSWKISLHGSEAFRKKSIIEWSKPENNIGRAEAFNACSGIALEKGVSLRKIIRELQGIEEDPPLPDPLPDEYKGQPPSTIRALLRQKKSYYDMNIKAWVNVG